MSGTHRIEVDRDETGEVESVRFVCDGDDSAPCHFWPSCECEAWGDSHYAEPWDRKNPMAVRTPLPGHENVQQRTCWVDPWFNETTDGVVDWVDLYEGPEAGQPVADDDSPDAFPWLVSGSVDVTFEGDCMTWRYAS